MAGKIDAVEVVAELMALFALTARAWSDWQKRWMRARS